MRDQSKAGCAAVVVAAMMALPSPAMAAERFVDLRSSGGYESVRFSDDVTAVDLDRQYGGACRFGRTWGYDMSNRELWVNGGCSGRFKLTTNESSVGSNSSNVGAAVAAAAAIAGIAILASRHKDDHQEPDYDPYYDDNYYGRPGYSQRPGNRPPPPSYRPRPGDSYGSPIRGIGGMCLDIAGGARSGAPTILYPCNNSRNQRFTLNSGGEIRVAGLCLDVQGASRDNGARAIAYRCNGQSNQRWRRYGNRITSVASGKCLDVQGGRARANQPVVLWDCNNQPNQRWWW